MFCGTLHRVPKYSIDLEHVESVRSSEGSTPSICPNMAKEPCQKVVQLSIGHSLLFNVDRIPYSIIPTILKNNDYI